MGREVLSERKEPWISQRQPKSWAEKAERSAACRSPRGKSTLLGLTEGRAAGRRAVRTKPRKDKAMDRERIQEEIEDEMFAYFEREDEPDFTTLDFDTLPDPDFTGVVDAEGRPV